MKGPAVRFPHAKMARGKSIVLNEGLLQLTLAREKSARWQREAAAPAAAESIEFQEELAPSVPVAGSPAVIDTGLSFEEQLEEQLKAEEARMLAAGEPVPPLQAASFPKERGRSSLTLLRAKRRKTTTNGTTVSAFVLLRSMLRLRRYKAARVATAAPANAYTSTGDIAAASSSRVSAGTPPRTVGVAIERMHAAGKDDNWEVRNAAIVALPALLGSLEGEAFKMAVGSLGEAMALQLADLRSAIVRSACDVLRELVTIHTRDTAPLVAHVLPQLLHNFSLLKVFKDVSATTATIVLGLAPSGAALKALVLASEDPKKQVRQGSLELLGLLLGDDAFTIPANTKGLTLALSALGTSSDKAPRGVTDKDADARTAAARCYWAAKLRYAAEGYPEQAKLVDGWFERLADKEKKLVEKQRDWFER